MDLIKNKFSLGALILAAIFIIVALGNVLSTDETLYHGIRLGKIFYQLTYLNLALPITVALTICSRRPGLDGVTLLLFLIVGWMLFTGREGGLWQDEKIWYFFTCVVFFLMVKYHTHCDTHLRDTSHWVLIAFSTAISLIGGLEALLGELQLLNRYTIFHPDFRVTGTFFNPAPFAGYLVASLPYAISLTLQSKEYKYPVFRWIGWLTALMIVVILPATQSRAAWIGLLAMACYYVYHHYKLNIRIRNLYKSRSRQVITLSIVLTALLLTLCYSLYQYKRDSADGRLLIWKVSATILQQKPWTGVGFNTFQAHYAPALAQHFSSGKGSKTEKILADNVQWAFNEPLQIAIELGVPCLLLYIVLIIAALALPIKEKWQQERYWLVLLAARSSLVAIVIFGLFSYPFHAPSTTLLFFFSLAVIASALKAFNTMWWSYLFKGVTLSFLIATGYNTYGKLQERRHAYRLWRNGMELYNIKSYKGANEIFQEAEPVLATNGQFLQQYGKSLQMAGDNERAVEILNISGKFYKDDFWYLALGEAHKQAGNYSEAEKHYTIAAQMVPHKLYPRYLLAKLYDSTGQELKATALAKDILSSEIKIKSPAAQEIQHEMRYILNKYETKTP